MIITPEEMSLYFLSNFQPSDMHVCENAPLDSLPFERLHVILFEAEKCLRNLKRKALANVSESEKISC